MARKKTENWFDKQHNDIPKRITWYLFAEPETPKTISLKIYPKYACRVKKDRQGHIKPFVSPYLSSHKDESNKVGYKDYTPKNYFSIIKKTEKLKYDKDKIYLNLNFLFDYLKDKIKLEKQEIESLEQLFNDWKVRKFLFEWNKSKNERLSYKKDKTNIEVFDFERDVIDGILTFFRCIYIYDEFELFIKVFDNHSAKEYLNIAPIVKDFRLPKNEDKKIDRILAFKHHRIYTKIEEIFPRKLFLEYKNDSIDLENPRDLGEKKIWVYLMKSKRHKIESLLIHP